MKHNQATVLEPLPLWKLYSCKQYELAELPNLGWLHITHTGEENVYFTLPGGSAGYVKTA